MTPRAFRAIRTAWIVLASSSTALAIFRSNETAGLILALLSYPAGALGTFLQPFPVRIEGLPDPEVFVVPLAMFALGFLQWFVVAPRLGRTMASWRSAAPGSGGASRAFLVNGLLLFALWVSAEAASILISTSLEPMTHRFPHRVGAVLFHVWLAAPAIVVAVVAAFVIVRLFAAHRPLFWVTLFATLGLASSAMLQSSLLFDGSFANRVGVFLEIVAPAVLCVLAGLSTSRRVAGRSA